MNVWLHIILLLQKSLPPRCLLNTGGLCDSGFGLIRGLQTSLTVPTSAYVIDILKLCVVILYTHFHLLTKRFWIWIKSSALYNFWFKNAFELLNLRVLKISTLYKNYVFQCMGQIFCVEFKKNAWLNPLLFAQYTRMKICCVLNGLVQGLILLIWFNFNPSLDK